MNELRGILTVIGIGVIVFVYWYSRREQQRKNRIPSERREPRLAADQHGDSSAESELPDVPIEPVDTPAGASASGVARQVPEKIVAIRLVGRGAKPFPGEQLILAMRGLGLRHGKFGIFHRNADDQESTVFSVASLVEPGSFDLAAIREQELPGVSLFLVLPGPLKGPEAFDAMVGTARTLAKTLDGEVLDSAGSSLSIQRERFIREEIIQFELGLSRP